MRECSQATKLVERVVEADVCRLAGLRSGCEWNPTRNDGPRVDPEERVTELASAAKISEVVGWVHKSQVANSLFANHERQRLVDVQRACCTRVRLLEVEDPRPSDLLEASAGATLEVIL